VQESVKTKHPQLLYESKLYRILQGGSKLLLTVTFVASLPVPLGLSLKASFSCLCQLALMPFPDRRWKFMGGLMGRCVLRRCHTVVTLTLVNRQ